MCEHSSPKRKASHSRPRGPCHRLQAGGTLACRSQTAPAPSLIAKAATASAAAAVASEPLPVDAEALRGVFARLLEAPSSRQLLRQLLQSAAQPFDDAAFEAQVC